MQEGIVGRVDSLIQGLPKWARKQCRNPWSSVWWEHLQAGFAFPGISEGPDVRWVSLAYGRFERTHQG